MMRQATLRTILRTSFASLTFVATGALVAGEGTPPSVTTFGRDVQPILKAHCLKCHGAEVRKGGLDLRTPAAALKGGDNGPAVVARSAGESLILEQVVSGTMPPGKARKLTEAEIATIRSWIDRGAPSDVSSAPTEEAVAPPAPSFWAFRPPKRPTVPANRDKSRVRNAVDAFVLARLETKGIGFSPDADRTTLARRAYLNLWGVPPSPEEVDAFVADPAPDAYERLIDRLLASPRYGERWGRHWLDVAGYADSEGILDADYVRSAAWRYRDYVIRSLNADKPYDRFLQEQIAGDELVDYWTAYRTRETLPPDVVDALVATGFLRCASDTSRPDFVNIKNAPGYYYQTLDDTLKIVASATLGLTLQCARCHTHKYDPITQEEYYRVQAVFMGAYRPGQWVPQVERRLWEATEGQEAEAKAHNAKVQAAVDALRQKVTAVQKEYGERLFQERLAALPEVIREDVRGAFATEPAKQSEVQKYLTGKFQPALRPAAPMLAAELAKTYPDYKTRVASLEGEIRAEEARRRTFPEIRALYDLPGEVKTPILKRGDYRTPGNAVAPGALAALGTPRPFAWTPPAPPARSSGRRLAFASWLTQPDHPLTARVLINRLWLLHFGEGLVATPDNFGTTGTPPSHPELLDWLACELVARGWSLKAMHRLILTSTTYRQSSRIDPATHARAIETDPEDRLLWRQRLRRLEAEPLRDAIVSVSATLNSGMFGPPIAVERTGEGEVVTPAGAAGGRRSLYYLVRRSQPLSFLQALDQPVMETNCTRRSTSTVASQALNLLNSEFLGRQAEALATRALRDEPRDPAPRAFRLALSRSATSTESARLREFVDAQAGRHARAGAGERARPLAMADLCQMLLSSNEFAYVD
ncbi:MAG: PSD1 and planctomycete cytochrome C domain-containing protein [Isosphaeraceae bacterium]|nr:PSD1 and planctomycete cytochrome C domain-containing protein [Isosphaeraceae bacterium]